MDPDAIATAEACLNGFGYSFASPREGEYRFHAVTRDGTKWRAQLVVTPEAILRLWIFVTDTPLYPAIRQAWVRQAAERLNSIVLYGSFTFQADSGAIILRDSELLREAAIDDVEWLLNRNALAIGLWKVAYDVIASETGDAESAVTFSLLLHGCADDEATMTNSQRRKLWSVASGAESSKSDENQPPLLSLL